MKRIVVLAGALLVLVSCLSNPSPSDKPAWVDNKFSKYPENAFMVEIGQGSSLKKAKASGAASLAQIFKTSIKVETTIQTRYKELSSGGDVETSEETNYNEDITQLADQELINVNFGESWTNELGQVSVLAYIDRQATANIYRERINENGNTIRAFISRSADQSSIIRKYAYSDAAYVVAQANQVLIEQMEIINLPMSRTIIKSYDLNQIRDDKKEIAYAMTFHIYIENDEEGKITSVLTDELTSFGFSIDPAGSLAVTGSIAFEDVKLDNDMSNKKYYLTLNIEDENDIPVVSIEENDRISAVSESSVKSLTYREIEKVIKKELIGQFIQYLDSFVQ